MIVNKDVSMASHGLVSFFWDTLIFSFYLLTKLDWANFLSSEIYTIIFNLMVVYILWFCRGFEKQIGQKRDFTFVRESQLFWRRQQYKMAWLYDGS